MNCHSGKDEQERVLEPEFESSKTPERSPVTSTGRFRDCHCPLHLTLDGIKAIPTWLRGVFSEITHWRSPKRRFGARFRTEIPYASTYCLERQDALRELAKNHDVANNLRDFEADERRMRPLISVVIPFHNPHVHFDQTVRSLDGQSLRDFEVLVVNYGFTDSDSIPALEPLRQREDWRVIDHANRGRASACNKGAVEAKGEYLLFLDPDDVLDQTAMEKMYWLLSSDPAIAFAYPGIRHIEETGRTSLTKFHPWRLRIQNFLASTTLIRIRLYLDLGGKDEGVFGKCADHDFWLELLDYGLSGRLIPEALLQSRSRLTGQEFLAHENKIRDEIRRIRRRHSGWNAWSTWKSNRRNILADAVLDNSDSTDRTEGESIAVPSPDPCFSPNHFWSRSRGRVVLLLGFRPGKRADSLYDYFLSRGYDITLILENHSIALSHPIPGSKVEESFSLPDLGLSPFTAWRFLRSIIMTRCADLIVGSDSITYVEMQDRIHHLSKTISLMRITGTSPSHFKRESIYPFERNERLVNRRTHEFIENMLSVYELPLPSETGQIPSRVYSEITLESLRTDKRESAQRRAS